MKDLLFLILVSIILYSFSYEIAVPNKELNTRKFNDINESKKTEIETKINEPIITYSDNIFLCEVGVYGLDMDINLDWDEQLDNKLSKVIKKYRKNNQSSDVFINSNLKEFSEFTNVIIGDKYFVSTESGVYESYVIGYTLWECPGIHFYVVLSKPKEVSSYENYNKYICSKNPNMSKMNFIEVSDNSIRAKIISNLKSHAPKIKTKSGYSTEQTTKIFAGNFTKGNDVQYVVSCVQQIDFMEYASGVFIFDSEGNWIADLFEFKRSDFNFTELVGISDYNSDGKNEVLYNFGYHEGSSYNLIEFNGSYFVKIVSGFNVGA